MTLFGQQSLIWAVGAVAAVVVAVRASADTGVTVAVDARQCQALIDHRAAPDVAYQPGVDSRGRAVTAADLTPPIAVPAPTEFAQSITIDLAERYGLGETWDAELKVPVADVVFRQGRVYVNGQPVTGADADRIAAACASR